MAASARFFRRFTTTAGVLLLVTLLGSVAGAATASASSTYTASAYASRLAQLVNSARAQHGVAPLRIVSGTTTVAAGWTAQLARQRALSHNPDLIPELQRHGSASATDVAENVGQGLPND